MASRTSCTAYNFRHIERSRVSSCSRLHGFLQTVRPNFGSGKRFPGNHLGSTIQRKFASEHVSRSQDFRYINFPNTRKGRKAEREAYQYWAACWRSTPETTKPLVFKINDTKLSDSSGVIDVSREGIVFPAGDRRGEKYWRLAHPLSPLAKLRIYSFQLRSGLALGSALGLALLQSLPQRLRALALRLRIWLYGGPSLPLSAKFQWLVSGPSPQPWSKRSRWVRWPLYGLFFTLTTGTIFILRRMEQAPLTGRWRINFESGVGYAEIMEIERNAGLEELKMVFGSFEPLAEPHFGRVNAIFARILLACGLENTVWQFYLVNGQGKHPIIACVSAETCYHVCILIPLRLLTLSRSTFGMCIAVLSNIHMAQTFEPHEQRR